MEVEGITKEQDEEIMKLKQRQMFLDDVGVTVAMIAVTLLAVSVVLLKVLIFSDKVRREMFEPVLCLVIVCR